MHRCVAWRFQGHRYRYQLGDGSLVTVSYKRELDIPWEVVLSIRCRRCTSMLMVRNARFIREDSGFGNFGEAAICAPRA